MENINGEWIMKGCDSSDPSALHSKEEMTSLIHTIGFFPLFSMIFPASLWKSGYRHMYGGRGMRQPTPGSGG